jgi:hypothetical protein
VGRLTVSIPTASADGLFYGRYPQGNAPATTLSAAAVASILASGALKTGVGLAGALAAASAASGTLSTGSGTGSGTTLHPGDAWSIKGTGLPVINLSNYGFNGDPTGDIETTAVNSTPNAGHNTSQSPAPGGINNFNYTRYASSPFVISDATRGKVITTGLLSGASPEASVEFVSGSLVPLGGKIRMACWLKAISNSPLWSSSGNPDAQLKYFRFEGWDSRDDISDLTQPNYVVHELYGGGGASDWSMDIGGGNDQFYGISPGGTIVNSGKWFRVEIAIQINTAAGTRNGSIWCRTTPMGASTYGAYSNTTTSGGINIQTQAQPYTDTNKWGSLICQMYGKDANNWQCWLDDLQWADTFAGAELWNSPNPALANKRETLRVTSSSSTEWQGTFNVGGGQYQPGDSAYIVIRDNQAADVVKASLQVTVGS